MSLENNTTLDTSKAQSLKARNSTKQVAQSQADNREFGRELANDNVVHQPVAPKVSDSKLVMVPI